MQQFLLMCLLVSPVLGATWRVALKAEKFHYRIYEVEWYSDAACSTLIANSDAIFGGTSPTNPSRYGRNNASHAFDGKNGTAYKATWDAKCGNDRCFWVAMGRLQNVRCVKVFQLQTDWEDGWTMTVERLDGQKNTWEQFGEKKVEPGWNEIGLQPYTSTSTTCGENQNVVNGQCQVCPAGGTNPAGDDSLDYNTVCRFDLQICEQNFHVKDGYCQECPAGLANNAGDRNDKGDTQCDDNNLNSVFSVDVGVKLAVEGNNHQSTKGTVINPLYPRKIASAVCGNSYFVAFTSQINIPISNVSDYGAEGDTHGHVVEFEYSVNSFQLKNEIKFRKCREMVDVEVSDSATGNCSVITALCISEYETHRFQNHRDFETHTDMVQARKSDLGWTPYRSKTPKQCGKTENPILGMYLLEWNSANGGLQQKPAAAHLINKAIGNWRMGDWVISANKDSTLLSVDLEVTVLGGDCNYHEGSLHTAWDRSIDGTLTYNPAWSRDWSIGQGHTHANRLAYNSELDNFGQFGFTDDKGFSRRFSAISADSDNETPKGTVLYRQRSDKRSDNIQSGGTSEVISFGIHGFIGSTTGAMPNQNKERSMLAIARLPGTKVQWDKETLQDKTLNTFKKTVLVWMQDLITPGYSAGWSSISHVGLGDENTNHFLLGWGEYEGESNVENPLPSGGFYVVEVDKDGKNLTAKKRIDNSGWRDKQDWLYIPATGCVVWPGAWNANGPKGNYGGWTAKTSSLFSTELRISEYCTPTGAPSGARLGWLDTDVEDEEIISSATTGAEPALRMALSTAAVVVALLFVVM